MKYKVMVALISCLVLTGCSTIAGIKPRETIPSQSTTSAIEQYEPEETTTVASGEGLIEPETKKSLGDISIDGDGNEEDSRFGQLVVPTRPTERTTEETTTEAYTTQEVATIQYNTTEAYTEPSTTARDWGDTPNIYSSSFGQPKYKTNVEVPDKDGIKKDSYGNYIIPYEMYSYSQQLPFNERNKIPYVFWYDEYGNILNPFPDELDKYKYLYELGIYEDENKLSHLLPTVPVN